MGKLSLALKINGVIIGLFVVGMIMAIISVSVFSVTKSRTNTVSNATVLSSGSQAILSGYLKMRFDARNYMLTGVQSSYDSFMSSREGMNPVFDELKTVMADKADLLDSIAGVEKGVNGYVDSLIMGRNERERLLSAISTIEEVNDVFAVELNTFLDFTANMLKNSDINSAGYKKLLDQATRSMVIAKDITEITERVTGYAVESKSTLSAAKLNGYAEVKAQMAEHFAYYESVFTSAATRAILSKLTGEYAKFDQAMENIITIIAKIDADDVERRVIGAEVNSLLDKLVDTATTESASNVSGLQSLVTKATAVIAVVLIAFAAIGAVSLFFVNKGVISKIKEFVVLMKEFTSGDGDLTKRIPVTTSDEIGQLGNYVNDFVGNIQGIITQVKEAADDVASGNTELAATMEELSTTFNSQSEQVSSVASNIGLMNETSQSIAVDLRENIEQMHNANEEVASGNSNLQSVLSTMHSIKEQTSNLSTTITSLAESSDQIGEILNVINGIADQTNLLALNAAIEAARAGEAGRGFAVVADEVRKLAEGTQRSISEISTIIATLQKDSRLASEEMLRTAASVDDGVERIGNTSESMQHIVTSVTAVGQSTEHVGTEISNQFDMMNDVSGNTQAIAAGVEESVQVIHEVATTVAHLQRQADQLKTIVMQFKI